MLCESTRQYLTISGTCTYCPEYTRAPNSTDKECAPDECGEI